MIPLHLIAGPLGAGKSTAILDFVRRGAGRERIGVLTNDYGRTGLDATILRGEGQAGGAQLRVENIPGGCLCCSPAGDFRGALQTLLEEDLTRVIVEPSGLAILSDLLPELRELCRSFGLQFAPVIVMVNAKRVTRRHYEELPFFADLIDHAEILVGNRTDQCSADERARFVEWTHALQPSKHMVVTTRFGKLPEAVFERLDRAPADSWTFGSVRKEPAPAHEHPQCSGGFQDGALPEIRSQCFLRELDCWAREGFAGGEVYRLKALLPTEQGWQLFEIAEGMVYSRAMPESDAARLDWITERPVEEARMRAVLAACAR